MKPIKFKGQNTVFTAAPGNLALPLPALRTSDCHVVSCWKMTFSDRIRTLFTGIVWLCVNGERPQPATITTDRPFYEPNEIIVTTRSALIGIILSRKPIGRFYAQDGPSFIGVDNSTGEIWTEEFFTKRQCIRWLKERKEPRNESIDGMAAMGLPFGLWR